MTPAAKLIGRVIGDPSRTGVVRSIHGGRVIPLESGIPRIGQFVRKGDVLARVDPYLPLADRTTISERSGEIEQLIALAESKIRRLRPPAERGAVPQGQVTDLETELEGLRLRREAIRNTRTEPELLRAPTDGVIALAKAAPGQVVQPQDVMFQIVDPKGFWVEALVYGDVDPNSRRRIVAYGNGDGRRHGRHRRGRPARLAGFKLPQGYTTSLEGTFQAQEEAALRIGALSLISLSLIFIVLYSRYRSVVLALIIMGGIPFALIGSVIALNVSGHASMIGFITLTGISAATGTGLLALLGRGNRRCRDCPEA